MSGHITYQGRLKEIRDLHTPVAGQRGWPDDVRDLCNAVGELFAAIEMLDGERRGLMEIIDKIQAQTLRAKR